MARTDRRQVGLLASDPTMTMALAALISVFVLLGLVWLGGTVGAWASGAGWHPPRYGPAMLFTVMRGQSLWPGVGAPWIVGGIAVVGTLILAPIVAVAAWWKQRSAATIPGLATPADLKEWVFKERVKQARRLRPSLADTPRKQIEPHDVGLPIGRLAGAGIALLASLEDVILVLAGPRFGKTSRVVAALVLAARGCCIVTSARYDIYSITARYRERKGEIALFDPQLIAHQDQKVWWNILSMARILEGARRLAMHLAKAAEDPTKQGGDAFFTGAGRSTLVNFLHAAAIDDRPLAEFLRWTSDQTDRTAARILRAHGLDAMADAQEKLSQLAQETQDGIFQHVREAVQPLYDPQIVKWVTPQEGCKEIKPAEWVLTHNTIYLLSKNGGGGAAAIIAAITDAFFRAGVVEAEANGTGRLDPTLLAVLDEAANICKIEDLPQMKSVMGGYGIQIVTILQNYRQGVRTWGADGMDALWSACTAKLIGAGLDDHKFLNEISDLIGMRAILEESFTSSRGGNSSTRSKRRERIMEAPDLREMDKGNALLFGTSTRPALVEMEAYYERPDGDELSKHKEALDAEIAQAARRRMKEAA